MGLTFYLATLASDDRRFRASRFPVALLSALRGLRQRGRRSTGRDLAGKRFGETFCYGPTRGLGEGLAERRVRHFAGGVRWVIGGLDQPMARWDWLPFGPPARRSTSSTPGGAAPRTVLEPGRSTRCTPRTSRGRCVRTRVRRRFPTSSRSNATIARTRIFPIMHTVVIRRDLYSATLDRGIAIRGVQGGESRVDPHYAYGNPRCTA